MMCATESERLTKMEGILLGKCHHTSEGLSTSDAAKDLGITIQMVDRHLASAKLKVPHMFPLLTAKQAKILHLYTVEGWSVAMIAEVWDIAEGTVRGYLRRLREKGVLHDSKPNRPLSFDENTMSDRVTGKW